MHVYCTRTYAPGLYIHPRVIYRAADGGGDARKKIHHACDQKKKKLAPEHLLSPPPTHFRYTHVHCADSFGLLHIAYARINLIRVFTVHLPRTYPCRYLHDN